MEIRRALTGESSRVLSREMAQLMVTRLEGDTAWGSSCPDPEVRSSSTAAPTPATAA